MQDHLAVVESPVLVEPLIHCLVAIGKSYKRELQPCFKVCRLTCGRALLKGRGGAGQGQLGIVLRVTAKYVRTYMHGVCVIVL